MNKKILLSVLILGFLVTVGASSVLAKGWFNGKKDIDPERIMVKKEEMFKAKADLLGISIEQLKEYWSEGKNIGEIAAEMDISEEELRSKIQESHKAKMTEHLNLLVERGRITQEQADTKFTYMQERMDNCDGHVGKFTKDLKGDFSHRKFNRLNK